MFAVMLNVVAPIIMIPKLYAGIARTRTQFSILLLWCVIKMNVVILNIMVTVKILTMFHLGVLLVRESKPEPLCSILILILCCVVQMNFVILNVVAAIKMLTILCQGVWLVRKSKAESFAVF